MLGMIAAVICAAGNDGKCLAVNMKIEPKAAISHEQCVIIGRDELAKYIAKNRPGYDLLFIGCRLVQTEKA